MPIKREVQAAKDDDERHLVHTSCMQDTFTGVCSDLRQAAARMQSATRHAQQWADSALRLSTNATLASTGNMCDLLSLMLLEEGAPGAPRAGGIAQDLRLPWAPARSADAAGGLTARTATRKQRADSVRRAAERNNGDEDLAPDPYLQLQTGAEQHEFLFPVLPAPERLRLTSRALRLPVHSSVLPADGLEELPEHLRGPVAGGPGLYLLPTLPPLAPAQARPQWAHGPVLAPGTLRGALQALAPLLGAGEALETATQVRAKVVRGKQEGDYAIEAHVGLEEEWAKALNAPFAAGPIAVAGGGLLQPVLSVAVTRGGAAAPVPAVQCSILLPGMGADGVLRRVQEGTVRASAGVMGALWALHRPQTERGAQEGGALPGVPPPGLVCGTVERHYADAGMTLHMRVSLQESPPPKPAQGPVAVAEAFLEAALRADGSAEKTVAAVDGVAANID